MNGKYDKYLHLLSLVARFFQKAFCTFDCNSYSMVDSKMTYHKIAVAIKTIMKIFVGVLFWFLYYLLYRKRVLKFYREQVASLNLIQIFVHLEEGIILDEHIVNYFEMLENK